MVTFTESEYGPGFQSGDGDSSHDGNGGYAVVVNGHSLVHALHPQLDQLFLELASQCKCYSSFYIFFEKLIVFNY